MYSEYLEFATSLARKAGDMMRAGRETSYIQNKADDTPVTDIDKAINQAIITSVATRYPEHGVLGEEASSQADKDWLWVCDPIDGTVAFIMHMPLSAFSLALVHKGMPIVAVIYNPWTDEMFTALQGEGAYRNNKRIHVSSRHRRHGTQPILMIPGVNGSSGLFSSKAHQLLANEEWFVVHSLGLAYRGCLIAEGAADATVYNYVGAHDVAALALIVTEAGGQVTDLDGHSQEYNKAIRGALISNGQVHEDLRLLVKALTK